MRWAGMDAVDQAIKCFEAYAKWEADVILANQGKQGGPDEYPTLTADLMDRLIALQDMRAEVVRALRATKTE